MKNILKSIFFQDFYTKTGRGCIFSQRLFIAEGIMSIISAKPFSPQEESIPQPQ